MAFRRFIASLAFAAAVASCSGRDEDGSGELLVGPTSRNGSNQEGPNGLAFGTHEPIRLKDGAPPLLTEVASAWAVQGRRSEIRIRYAPASEGKVPEEVLALTIPPNTVMVAPNGNALAKGDSIRVQVRMVRGELRVVLAPHGLRFVGGGGAQLSMSYRYGDTRGRDPNQLRLWYYPEGGRAELVPSAPDLRCGKVNGRLDHFSNYAIAY